MVNFGNHKAKGYSGRSLPDQSDKLQIPIDPSMMDEETLEEMLQAIEDAASAVAEEDEDHDDDEDDDEDAGEGHDEYLPEDPEVEYVLPIAQEQPEETEAKGDTPVSWDLPSEDGPEESPQDQGHNAPSDDGEDGPEQESGGHPRRRPTPTFPMTHRLRPVVRAARMTVTTSMRRRSPSSSRTTCPSPSKRPRPSATRTRLSTVTCRRTRRPSGTATPS